MYGWRGPMWPFISLLWPRRMRTVYILSSWSPHSEAVEKPVPRTTLLLYSLEVFTNEEWAQICHFYTQPVFLFLTPLEYIVKSFVSILGPGKRLSLFEVQSKPANFWISEEYITLTLAFLQVVSWLLDYSASFSLLHSSACEVQTL